MLYAQAAKEIEVYRFVHDYISDPGGSVATAAELCTHECKRAFVVHFHKLYARKMDWISTQQQSFDLTRLESEFAIRTPTEQEVSSWTSSMYRQAWEESKTDLENILGRLKKATKASTGAARVRKLKELLETEVREKEDELERLGRERKIQKTTPVTPVTPTDPVAPTDPTDPVAITDPVTPTDPTDPVTPTKITTIAQANAAFDSLVREFAALERADHLVVQLGGSLKDLKSNSMARLEFTARLEATQAEFKTKMSSFLSNFPSEKDAKASLAYKLQFETNANAYELLSRRDFDAEIFYEKYKVSFNHLVKLSGSATVEAFAEIFEDIK